LGALALLAAGVTFHGIKIKDRKEKEKIENEMKKLLVWNAEKELEDFKRENRELEKYIAYYDAKIQELTPDTLISKSDGDTLYQLVSDMYEDWHSVAYKFVDEYEDIGYRDYANPSYFDDDALPESAKVKLKYLMGGMLKKYHDKWEPRVAYKDYVGYSFSHYTAEQVYVERVLSWLTNQMSDIAEYDFKAYQERVIKKLTCLVDNIDNSGGVINPKTLLALKKKVAELSQKANFEKRQELEKEKHPFDVAKGKVELHMARNNDMRFALGQMQQVEK